MESLTKNNRSGGRQRAQETILVVEDEPTVRDLICRVLENQGYKVLSAPNGTEALQICNRHKSPLNAVVTDIIMPEMSGMDLARQLAELHPRIKIVFMSGYDQDTFARQRDWGAPAPMTFLQKPFTAMALAQRIKETLEK